MRTVPMLSFANAQRQHASEYLSACLAKTRGNVAAAARLAGLNRTHFYKLCSRFGVSQRRPIYHTHSRLISAWRPPEKRAS